MDLGKNTTWSGVTVLRDQGGGSRRVWGAGTRFNDGLSVLD